MDPRQNWKRLDVRLGHLLYICSLSLIAVFSLALIACRSIKRDHILDLVTLGMDHAQVDSVLRSNGFTMIQQDWWALRHDAAEEESSILVDFDSNNTLSLFSASGQSIKNSLRIVDQFDDKSKYLTEKAGKPDSTIRSATILAGQDVPHFLSYSRYSISFSFDWSVQIVRSFISL
jgi:hypothetical protein